MIAFEPNAEREFILSEHRERKNPPKFYFKALSAREILKPKKILNELIDLGDVTTEDELDKLIDGIQCGLSGWQIDGCKYDPDAIADICTINQLFELLGFVTSDGLTYEDKKKSESEP